VKRRKPTTYEVTRRRDVQQVARVRMDAESRQEAIDAAESSIDSATWSVEKPIGIHKPEVRREVRR
jgi:hypothetical protein